MALYRVINRYATALIESALQVGKLEEIYNDSMLFVNTCNENRELLVLLKNPTIHGRKKLSIFKLVFESSFDQLTIEFIKLIIRHSREAVLKDVFLKFIELYKDHKEIVDAEIVSAIPLTDDILKQIKTHIVKISKSKDVVLANKVDKEIIGGFTLKFKDKMLDNSISTQLKNLEKHLLEK